jgi:mevalonate kinase
MFPAKLLLFGEHSLMYGSGALAIPFNRFSGEWVFGPHGATPENRLLTGFADYLIKEESKLGFNIDIGLFKSDISEGLYFDSTIPMGYGIGSSGAISAAFYSKYAVTPIPPNCSNIMLPILRGHLAQLEKYFHGTSSGIDPLVSYTHSPILVGHNGTLQRLKVFAPKNVSLFLIDTGYYGETGKNVRIFREMMEKKDYSATVRNRYIPVVNQCIDQIVSGNVFFSAVFRLSGEQQNIFGPMIPLHVMKYFKKAADDGDFALKLCGSGGGGFLLGFTLHIGKVMDYFASEKMNLILIDYD